MEKEVVDMGGNRIQVSPQKCFTPKAENEYPNTVISYDSEQGGVGKDKEDEEKKIHEREMEASN